jgi:hypothetical protein
MPDINFSVHVVDENDNPVEGVRVEVFYPWARNDHETTDEDGMAYFEKHNLMNPAMEIDVWVDGEKAYEQVTIEDGDSLTHMISR